MIAQGRPADGDEYYRELSLALVDLYFSPSHREEGVRILSGIQYNQAAMDLLQETYLKSTDLRPVLKCVSGRCFILVGANDRVTHPDYVRKGHSIPVVVIPGAGHFPFSERPQEFLDLIKNLRKGEKAE